MAFITLYVIPSPHGISWASPIRLALSAALNYLSPSRTKLHHYLGHVYVRLQSELGEDLVYAGMTNDECAENADPPMHDLLIKNKMGMSILFHGFKGRMQESNEVKLDLLERAQKKAPVSFLKVKISLEQLNHTMEFLSEFKKRGADRVYGLVHRPLLFEGSGCSAFGAACLERAKVLSLNLLNAWTRTVEIPEPLLSNKKPVPFYKMMRSKWVKTGEPSTSLFFWDPDLMHRWIISNENQSTDDLCAQWKGVEISRDAVGQNSKFGVRVSEQVSAK